MKRVLLLSTLGALALGCGADSNANSGSSGGGGQGGAPGTGAGGPISNGGGGSGGVQAGGGGSGGSTFVPGDPSGTTAIAVTDFLDSIGICTHVGQGVDDPDKSATAMSFAGIRVFRDDGHPEKVPDWIAMHKSAGVRLSVLTNQDVASTVDMAKSLNAAGALLAVEGPNEPNNFPVTYGGQTSNYMTTFKPVANLQKDLYAAVKAEPTLQGVPVFHSSEAGGSEPDNVGLQFLTIPAGSNIAMPDGTKYADYANTHNYVCGHSSHLVDNVAWNASDPTLNGDWDGPYVEYGHTWHGGFAGYSNDDLKKIPKVTTETGWVTTGDKAITLEQQGRLFLNLYLSAFKQGFSYTFIYMLRDDPNQGYWGLFGTDYQPKISGTYLHNLTTILVDSGDAGEATKLDYSIDQQPATVHDLLLRKHDGEFELVIWNERPMGGTNKVKIEFKYEHDSARIYDPTLGTKPTQMLEQVNDVTLTLGDHPMVIELYATPTPL